MHIVDRKKNLLDNICGLSFTHQFDLDNMMEEFTSCGQLRNDIEVCIILKQFHESYYMRMFSILQHFKFLLHQSDECLIFANQPLIHNLNCTLHISFQVCAESNFTECAFSKYFSNCELVVDTSFSEILEQSKLQDRFLCLCFLWYVSTFVYLFSFRQGLALWFDDTFRFWLFGRFSSLLNQVYLTFWHYWFELNLITTTSSWAGIFYWVNK